ncbi:phosphotransferase family protein [Pelagicoccus mobilis]|uniref:Aminoglycoside phosphotransferase family protein n=1 Tax=Pelagicoccus mobilis TaxID=415221 RepID=A0A934RW59_9BACT|nr:aminoglycoside phosphotransferase family protein [Pelagicoccus mobilis]MBK1875896.1 aminoglycoside phosphotransferase family protein [Pelagicoccus mobilis]
MSVAPADELKSLLIEREWIASPEATLTPLTGGVSSEIYLVEDGEKRFVVKRALAKLKVEADWFADTSRNHSEQAYIRYVGEMRPDAMPAIVGSDAEAGLFAMEFLDGFENWKQAMLAGECSIELAAKAGKLLGEIHAASWGDVKVLAEFDSIPNFDQLRIDPYLRATAEKHEDIKPLILAEAERLMTSRECLIHGDYSPKNILYSEDRLVPLDCEVACYADAAFDLSFYLNHLFLKSLYHAPKRLAFADMIDAAIIAYREGNPENAEGVINRTAKLLPMLMLARVDGKSPVEYLASEKQEFVRKTIKPMISHPLNHLEQVESGWFDQLYRL